MLPVYGDDKRVKGEGVRFMKRCNLSIMALLLSTTFINSTSAVVNAETFENTTTSESQTIAKESIQSEKDLKNKTTNETEGKDNATSEMKEQKNNQTGTQSVATETVTQEQSMETAPKETAVKEVTEKETKETEVKEISEEQTEESEAVVKDVAINFVTSGEHPFVTKDNKDSYDEVIKKKSNEKIEAKDFPKFGYSLDNIELKGWKDQDTSKMYTTAELLKLELLDNMTLFPVFNDLRYLSTFGMNDIPALPNDGKIKVISTIFENAVGTGPKYSADGKLLMINPAVKSQLGAIWSKKKLNMSKDFQFKSYLYLGNSKAKGADGITFTLQNDPRGAKALANAGQGLGAYSMYGKSDYIKNAISIEFDTYYNNGTKDPMDGDLDKNGNRGHIAVVTPSADNNRRNQHSAVTYPKDYLSNGQWRTVVFDWDATKQDLSYELVGVGSATYHIDDVEKQFGGKFVNWGFTSSTGGSFQDNAIAITDVPSSVSHVATIKNETQKDPNFARSTEVMPGDTVSINDHLILDESSPHFGQDAIITIDLKGTEYIEGSLHMDDVEIPKENIKYADDKLSITLGKVVESMADEADLNFKIKMGDAEPGTDFQYYFTYSEDGVYSDSNYVYMNVPLVINKTINVNFVDKETNKEIAKHTEITGKYGESYTAEPIDIDGYILESDSGNTTGILDKNSKDVTFYYRKGVLTLKEVPTSLDFKHNKISTKEQQIWPERKGQIIVSDERGSKTPGWRLNVKEAVPIHNNDTTLDNIFVWSDGVNEQRLSAEEVTIDTEKKPGDVNVTADWDETKDIGINVKVPVEKQIKGSYEGTLEWILSDTP